MILNVYIRVMSPILSFLTNVTGVNKIINLTDKLTDKIKNVKDGNCADGGQYPCEETTTTTEAAVNTDDPGKDTLDRLLELVKDITDVLKDKKGDITKEMIQKSV